MGIDKIDVKEEIEEIEKIQPCTSNISTTTGLDPFSYIYQTERAIGASHLEATHRAIDHWRKFTNREITSGWDVFAPNIEDEESIKIEDYINFNEAVRVVYASPDQKVIKFFSLLLRYLEIDRYLSEEHLRICNFHAQDFFPDKIYEIAIAMGWQVRENGGCTNITRYYALLAEIFAQNKVVLR